MPLDPLDPSSIAAPVAPVAPVSPSSSDVVAVPQAATPATPTPQPPVPSDFISRADYENQVREEANIRQEAYLVQQQVAQEMQARSSELQARGITEDEIQRDLSQYQQFRYGQYAQFVRERMMSQRDSQQKVREKRLAAMEAAAAARDYGVTVDQLMGANSREEMRIIVLEAENRALKARQGPMTQFGAATGSPAAGGGDDAFITAWGSGRLEASNENMARARRILGF